MAWELDESHLQAWRGSSSTLMSAGSGKGKLTVAEVLVHASIGSSLGTLHTLSNESLSVSSIKARGRSAYHLESLIGNLLDLDVHGSLLSLFISTISTGEGVTYGHDDEDHLRILLGLHECFSSSIAKSDLDSSKIETGLLPDNLGLFVDNRTSTLEQDGNELGNKVFYQSALANRRAKIAYESHHPAASCRNNRRTMKREEYRVRRTIRELGMGI